MTWRVCLSVSVLYFGIDLDQCLFHEDQMRQEMARGNLNRIYCTLVCRYILYCVSVKTRNKEICTEFMHSTTSEIQFRNNGWKILCIFIFTEVQQNFQLHSTKMALFQRRFCQKGHFMLSNLLISSVKCIEVHVPSHLSGKISDSYCMKLNSVYRRLECLL